MCFPLSLYLFRSSRKVSQFINYQHLIQVGKCHFNCNTTPPTPSFNPPCNTPSMDISSFLCPLSTFHFPYLCLAVQLKCCLVELCHDALNHLRFLCRIPKVFACQRFSLFVVCFSCCLHCCCLHCCFCYCFCCFC